MFSCSINNNRLQDNLKKLSLIGKNPQGGLNRYFGSEWDIQARKFIKDYWEKHFEAEIKTDAIGNLWAIKKGAETLPPILYGSHHDTVTNGGMYDGALGVLLATEIMETLCENGIKTRHPFGIVSFTGEEPNPFDVSTLGSKVLSGRLKKQDLCRLANKNDGSPLSEALEKAGGNIDKTDGLFMKSDSITAFIECHIEQGRRLQDRNKPLACVSKITGIYREKFTVKGVANHAGTTVMQDRKDALLAACEFNIEFEKMIRNANSDEVTGTIGQFDVYPNSVNIIPSEVVFIAEIRTVCKNIKDELTGRLNSIAMAICKKREVSIIGEINLDQPCIDMDSEIQDAICEGIRRIGEQPYRLASMAGHDAANIQRVTPAGMLFVRSPNGKSHCPDEIVYPSDMEKAGAALLSILDIIDGKG